MTVVSQSCKWTTRFLHNTGDKDAKVTFLTMLDNSLGSMVATAVQKKGHDKFVERFLLNTLESFGMIGELVLQTDRETGPIDVAKHVASESGDNHQTDSQENKRVRRTNTPKCRSHGQNHERGD